MASADKPATPGTCPVGMVDGNSCGRLIYVAPPGIDPVPVCLMHSRDPNKDKSDFRREVEAILNGTSERCLKDRFDFSNFIFSEADFVGTSFTQNTCFFGATFTQDAKFREAEFAQNADFSRATFTQDADFRGADFAQDADFTGATFTQDADFRGAEFAQNADFSRATFTQDADFRWAEFAQDADFTGATFTQDAHFFKATFTEEADFCYARFAHDTDFAWVKFASGANFSTATFSDRVAFHETTFGLPHERVATVAGGKVNPTPAVANFKGARFEQPGRVRFYRVNREASHGLRGHFVDCDIGDIQFVDVYWHQHEGRMALQDELVLYSEYRAQPESEYELVATAYRQMVNNFEKVRNYDLAEDCFIGAMEMKRLDPKASRSSRAIVTLYKWLSVYGSSYTRALGMLGGFLLAFGLLFPVFGLRMTDRSEAERVQCPVAAPGSPESSLISWGCAIAHTAVGREAWGTFKAGLLAAAETATFQRRPTLEPANNWGRALAMTEVVVIPGQLALLFLALRRRFRR